MIQLVRKLLFPFALIYGGITAFRNFLYNKNILSSHAFDFPIIAVGNLSVGGTGKTPMVEYLVHLLSHQKTGILSRGYKRKTKGFLLANKHSSVEDLGDEPYQFYQKFKNTTVAVCENRVLGVQNLLKHIPNIETIILDDAFQHRKIKASLYLLLTPYNDLFINDCVLPTGNLREPQWGAHRADIIIITKCPENLSPQESTHIKYKLQKYNKPVFFTTIRYASTLKNIEGDEIPLNKIPSSFLAVAGIAKPDYFYKKLRATKDQQITFPDHHNFSEKDLAHITSKAQGRLIITTEKDFMRLKHSIPANQLYYLPISQQFISDKTAFDQLITNHLKQ